MSKGILQFELPEEQVEFQIAVDAGKWRGVIWDFDQELRRVIKYSEPHNSEEEIVVDTYEKIRSKLWDIMKEEDLSL